ncbi:MAG: hypothetical protein ACR2OS_06025 [Paracoccaceae bacterium]
MSETDSFIDEVNEEVRRDRLYAALRRYGWIAIVAVLAIVGGAAVNEYRRASDLALAQQRGDAILQALESDTGESRSAALGEISTEGSAVSALVGLFRASELVMMQDPAAASDVLAALIGQESVLGDYSDLALFKQLLLEGSGLDASARRSGFEQLSAAGNPLRLLAQEQLALLDLQENDETAAVKRLRDLLQDAEMTQNLRQRLGQLMVALGQDPNALDG